MSSNAPLLHRFLYLSRLAPEAPPDAVSQILRQSRERNRANTISGALVFDGERFCQLLEGEPEAVRALAGRIRNDRRHCDVRVLFDETSAAPRLLPQWHSGYGDPEALDAVDRAMLDDDSDGATAAERRLAAFIRILPNCDMSL